MISPDVIEEVKRLADPVLLIGRRVKLWKSGTSYSGLCPFHEEKQASFRIFPKDKRFVCFGCGASGDIFQFFQRADGKAFPVVVRELAASLGIVIPPDAPMPAEERRATTERAALLGACSAAAAHWEVTLWSDEGAKAREYLAERRVSNETARLFRLGYAPAEWHDVERALRATKIAPEVQHAAGILAARDTDGTDGRPPRYYDRFRGRIIFPIEDLQGRAIGFGARALQHDADAKYLNGPETPLFKKSRALFGLWQAREAIRHSGKALLVEGYFDVLALHQAGFTSAVAACGSAVSAEQIELLVKAGCKELILFFDGDEAGAVAAGKAARVLFHAGVTARVARLPTSSHGQSDPDVLVARAGRRGAEEVLAAAKPLSEFLLDDAVQRQADGLGVDAPVEHKLAVLRAVTPFVLAAPEGVARATFERAVARRLGIDIGPLRQELQRVARAERPGSHP